MALAKILWVDDEIESLQSQKLFLENKGYEVHTLTNGFDAIDYVKENPVDVVLMDLLMPEMDGVELISHLAEQRFAGGVVLVSGGESTLVETAVHLLRAHGIPYLGHACRPLAHDQLAALWGEWRQRYPVA